MSIRPFVLLMAFLLILPLIPVFAAPPPPTITLPPFKPPPWVIFTPVTKELRASADSTLNSFLLTKNFGGESELLVGEGDLWLSPGASFHVVEYTVVDFDIYDQIPPGSEVTKAELVMTVKDPPSMGINVEVHPLTKSFTESTVTWSSHASNYGSTISTKSISFDAHGGTKIYFDVTSYVKSKVQTCGKFYGFLLKAPPGTNDMVHFYSREGASYDSWKPTLKITYKNPYIDLVASQTSLSVKQGEKAYVQLAIGGTFCGQAQLSHKWVGTSPSGITLKFSETSGKVPFASTLEVDVSDSTPPGQYKLEVKAKNKEGSYDLYDKVTITIQVTSAQEPDFTLSASPQSITVTQGQIAEYSITVTPVADFSGTVHFTASGIPPGSTYQFVSSGSNIYLRVATSSSTPPGDYTITVTAQGGGKTHTASVSLTVTAATTSPTTTKTTTTTTATTTQSFFIQVNPTALTLARGGMAYIIVRVQGLGGFSSPVTLSASGLPQGVSISSNVNNAPPDFTANITLVATNSAPLGTHQFTLIASGGGITRSSTITLTITQGTQTQTQTQTQTGTGTAQGFDFSISVTPTTLILNPASTGSVAVTVNRLRGSGTVTLSASGLPSDVRVMFNPPALQEGTSSLVIQAGQTTGTFTVIVTGVSGNVKRSATFQLQIRAEESRCIIATAAYGSELAPEVAYLRGFRDGTVMATYSGSRFLTVFNAFYYSWSPGVAAVIRQSPALASITRAAITPLIYTLKLGSFLYSLLPTGDLSMIATGSVVSLILGLVYLWPLSLLSLRFRRLSNPKYLKIASVIAAGSAILLGMSTAAMIDPLAMISASTLVLSCLSIPPLALSRLLASRVAPSTSH